MGTEDIARGTKERVVEERVAEFLASVSEENQEAV